MNVFKGLQKRLSIFRSYLLLSTFYLLFLWHPVSLRSQVVGIKFEQKLTWKQLKEKAVRDNKLIFVDCYTSWCGPCKLMDTQVYNSGKVAGYANEKFVSVKIKFDKNRMDDEWTKQWYPIVDELGKNYDVNSFPTFLFFLPDGKVVHKDIGFKNETNFLSLLAAALDSTKQVYTVIEQYRMGVKNYHQMGDLAMFVKRVLNNKNLSDSIGQDFLQHHLYTLSDNDLLTEEHISLMTCFMTKTNDRGFNLFNKYANRIDSLIGKKGYSQRVIDYLIQQSDINPRLWKENGKAIVEKPHWNQLKSLLVKKYPLNMAERNILNAKIGWYNFKKDWKNIARFNVLRIEKYGLDTAGIEKAVLNNLIWDVIFQHCNDKIILNKAINWMEILIKADSTYTAVIDTYANLLYKVGRVQEAIYWEEKAQDIEEERVTKFNGTPDKVYKETVEKMRSGIPTWDITEGSAIN